MESTKEQLWRQSKATTGHQVQGFFGASEGSVCFHYSAELRAEPLYNQRTAEVAELADAQDLGSCGRKAVWVQLPPSAPIISLMPRTLLTTLMSTVIGSDVGLLKISRYRAK